MTACLPESHERTLFSPSALLEGPYRGSAAVSFAFSHSASRMHLMTCAPRIGIVRTSQNSSDDFGIRLITDSGGNMDSRRGLRSRSATLDRERHAEPPFIMAFPRYSSPRYPSRCIVLRPPMEWKNFKRLWCGITIIAVLQKPMLHGDKYESA
jgi:hypothetical protein